jgi:hypothetical protein
MCIATDNAASWSIDKHQQDNARKQQSGIGQTAARKSTSSCLLFVF